MGIFGGREEGDKDYRTPINRQELGSALRYLFNLSGKRLAPPEMDVDTLKTVVDVSAGGFLSYEIQTSSSNQSIAGTPVIVFNVIDPNNPFSNSLIGSQKARNLNTDSFYTSGQSVVGPIIQWDARIQMMNFSFLFDAAGSIASNLKYITLKLFTSTPAGQVIDIWNGKAAFQIISNRLNYNGSLLNGFIALPGQGNGLQGLGGWNRFIPFGSTLQLQISSDDGTNFPANTTCLVDCYAMMTPKGVQSPW